MGNRREVARIYLDCRNCVPGHLEEVPSRHKGKLPLGKRVERWFRRGTKLVVILLVIFCVYIFGVLNGYSFGRRVSREATTREVNMMLREHGYSMQFNNSDTLLKLTYKYPSKRREVKKSENSSQSATEATTRTK